MLFSPLQPWLPAPSFDLSSAPLSRCSPPTCIKTWESTGRAPFPPSWLWLASPSPLSSTNTAIGSVPSANMLPKPRLFLRECELSTSKLPRTRPLRKFKSMRRRGEPVWHCRENKAVPAVPAVPAVLKSKRFFSYSFYTMNLNSPQPLHSTGFITTIPLFVSLSRRFVFLYQHDSELRLLAYTCFHKTFFIFFYETFIVISKR